MCLETTPLFLHILISPILTKIPIDIAFQLKPNSLVASYSQYTTPHSTPSYSDRYGSTTFNLLPWRRIFNAPSLSFSPSLPHQFDPHTRTDPLTDSGLSFIPFRPPQTNLYVHTFVLPLDPQLTRRCKGGSLSENRFTSAFFRISLKRGFIVALMSGVSHIGEGQLKLFPPRPCRLRKRP